MSKRSNNNVSAGKKIAHFFKHYFGYFLLALLCAVVTVLVIAAC